MADKLDLEETNRIRVSLGMQPLPAPSSGPTSNLNFKKSEPADDASDDDDEEEGSTLESRQALASGNWQALQAEQEEKKRKEAKRAQLKKQRDAAQRFAKLEGKGLGDADGDDQDAKSWLLGSQKRQRKIAKSRAQQLARDTAELENAAQYTEKDLKGVKVGHELGDFDEDSEQILTLKDAAVGDESENDDELENVNVREKEKLRERLELKKRKPVYDPNEMNEDGSKSILAQYDEEIDGGKKRKAFTLDDRGAPLGIRKANPDEQLAPGRTKISLDFMPEEKAPLSDYQDISEIKIKKPKKKKDKSKKRKMEDDEYDNMFKTQNDTAANGMDVDSKDPAPQRRAFDNAPDDDDLQSQLAVQRQLALKRRKKMRPEDLARELREAEGSASPAPMDTTDEGGLIFDETSRFVENLQKPETRDDRRASSPGKREPPVKRESPGSDAEMAEAPAAETAAPAPDATRTATGLEEEASLTHGLAGTLKMLTQRGLLEKSDGSSVNAMHRKQQRFLEELHAREASSEARARAQRERDRASGRWERMTPREREQYSQQMNAARDQTESRAAAELFDREYRPTVELKYVDEFGRDMNAREAFKHLSHQFHGKGSGKGKTEKRIKRIEDERARDAQSSLDASQRTGMNEAAGQTARRKGQAGVRLQ